MSIAAFIESVFRERLKKACVLTVYDPERRYRDICRSLADETCTVVDATEGIEAREKAMLALVEVGNDPKRQLLVYVPIKPPITDEERQLDPFSVYSVAGALFPDGDGDRFDSLCLKAKPDHATEIRGLFAGNASPSFALIDNVGGGLSWPTLRTCLGAESAREIILGLLVPTPKQTETLKAHEGWVQEAKALLERTMGLKLMTRAKTHSPIADEIWRFLLFSEFVFDLPVALPERLSNVPRAPDEAQTIVFDLCDTLRNGATTRGAYITRAGEAEKDLGLPAACVDIADLGVRSTFPFEERTFLSTAVKALLADDLDAARLIVERHSKSVWIGKGESQAQWELVDSALRLIEACDDGDRQLAENGRSLDGLIAHYAASLREIDRLQREFEQAVGDYIPSEGLLTGAIEYSRKRYAKLAEKIQVLFTRHLESTGWPSQALMSNADLFDTVVAPMLKESGRRVALIMVDALRYELGVTLHRQLAETEAADIRAACAQLPTVTPVGMTSLLPGAGTGLRLSTEGGALSVSLGGQKMASVANRMDVIRSLYGDRFAEMHLDEFRKPKTKIPDPVELLVLRTTDIDAHLENVPAQSLTTLSLIHQSLKSIRVVVHKLKEAGFADVVIATDHGFVLNAHAEAGDVCAKPAGTWMIVHDRVLLGEGEPDSNNFVLSAEKAGLRADFTKLGGPRSIAPYRRGLVYFHGGASLQEALVPIITVRLKKARKPNAAAAKVVLGYKNGATRITTRLPVIELTAEGDLFAHGESFEILLEAHRKAGDKGVVGEAKRGGAVDVATGTITVRSGDRLQVTIKMDLEFEGKFVLKALNPLTMAQYAALELETDYAV